MRFLRKIWSSSEFDAENVTRFAQPVVREEARQGIFVLGVLTMLLMAGLAILYFALGLGSAYLYTFGVLGALALHIALSAKMLAKTSDAKVFYLLGIVLLAMGALAFALLASRYSVFTATLFSGVATLFMVVPMVPWGVREALFAVGSVYLIFTVSTFSVARRFAPDELLTLQFLMVSAAAISLMLVWRATSVRKGHLEARFNLTQMNEKLALTSLQDPLTGAWNRRFLNEHYGSIAAGYADCGEGYCLALIDVDDFKRFNDTLGHPEGDRALTRLVSVLEEQVSDSRGYVMRVGGDEFLLLQGAGAREHLERARDALERRRNERPDSQAMPSVSIGVARVPSGAQVPLGDAYAVADQALYAAKSRGGGALVEMEMAQKLKDGA